MKLIKPICYTNCQLNFFSSRVVNYRNSLPPDIVNAVYFGTFVNRLNSHDLSVFCKSVQAQVLCSCIRVDQIFPHILYHLFCLSFFLSAALRSNAPIMFCYGLFFFYFIFLFNSRSQKLLDRFTQNFQELCILV